MQVTLLVAPIVFGIGLLQQQNHELITLASLGEQEVVVAGQLVVEDDADEVALLPEAEVEEVESFDSKLLITWHH